MSDIPGKQRRVSAGNGFSNPNAQIASKLKALYHAVEQEPIPDIFLDLLEKLDRAEEMEEPRL